VVFSTVAVSRYVNAIFTDFEIDMAGFYPVENGESVKSKKNTQDFRGKHVLVVLYGQIHADSSDCEREKEHDP
jgi:hypothetical protein